MAPKSKPLPAEISLEQIKYEGTQSRAEINEATVADYAANYRNKVPMPPVVLFYDGLAYYLADGFHRFLGASQENLTKIPCDVHRGSKRDAILYSVSANETHGLRRSNADKRAAITLLLSDAEWSTWSDKAIADKCHVDNHTVASVRAQLGNSQRETPVTQVETAPQAETVEPVTESQQPETPAATGDALDFGPVEEPKPTIDPGLHCDHDESDTPTVTPHPKRKGRDGKEYPASKPDPKPITDAKIAKLVEKALTGWRAIETALSALDEFDSLKQEMQTIHKVLKGYAGE